LNTDKLHLLPEECGVYYFHNEFDQVIYIGKAINIQKRAFQHFRKIGTKAANLYQRVHDISYELTGSELLALLLEAREIKRVNPEINKAMKNKQYNYIIYKEKNEAGYIELNFARNSKKWQNNPNLVRQVTNMKATRSFLNRFVDQFELCAKLCHVDDRTGPCFYYSLKKCFGACVDEEPADSYNARVEAAISVTHDRFDQDLIIEEDSLDHLEKVLFLIKQGEYKGHTIIQKDEESIPLEQIENRVLSQPFQPEYNRIIFNYLLENPHVKVHFI
jgi:DNA polymerase-3 subunit epsilon